MKLLVIDDNLDNRFLLAKTLLRRFPKAALIECQSLEVAVELVKKEDISLVVAHRTPEADGAALVRELRAANATVPIIAVSAVDRKEAALAAGATAFHLSDEWLLIGTAAASLLGSKPRSG